jgi:glycosyltransferase involved in cell wall biosynthesis
VRIAIVINTSWNIYNYRKGLIESLLKIDCEVLAIAPPDKYSDRLKELGCQFVPVKMDNKGINPLKDIVLFFKLLQVYRNSKADFILHYTIKPNVYGTLAAACVGIPCISNVSGLGTAFIRKGILLEIVKYLYRFAFRFPRRVFFQNKDDRELFLSFQLVAKERTGLLPGSGINLEQFSFSPQSQNKEFVFLLISRLLTDKGIKEYALACRLLKEKGYQFQSSLVGFFEEESKYNISREELQDWCDKGYIQFLGATDVISREISKVDCVVLPSYREGTPRSLLEAMALGRPIITTDVPGCREVLEEGRNGYSCQPRSVESLAAAMEKMVNLSEKERAQMGVEGRKIVEERFAENRVVEKYFAEIFDNKYTN